MRVLVIGANGMLGSDMPQDRESGGRRSEAGRHFATSRNFVHSFLGCARIALFLPPRILTSRAAKKENKETPLSQSAGVILTATSFSATGVDSGLRIGPGQTAVVNVEFSPGTLGAKARGDRYHQRRNQLRHFHSTLWFGDHAFRYCSIDVAV
jgi:hypothetical protein